MGKLLRILSVLFLLIGIAALWLGILLFEKREMLKGRTQKLENTLISLARFIESEPAEAESNSFPAKDASECTAEALENPELSEFWKKYDLQLEKQNLNTIDLTPRTIELMSYYLLDPITQKIMRDSMGYRVTKGKGTMQDLLDDVLAKTENQLKRLNETRNQLTVVREELVRTVEELNDRKISLRKSLAEIVQLNDIIAQKDAQIAQLNQEIADLQATIRQKDDEIAAHQLKIGEQEEEIKDLKEQVKVWKKRATEGKIGDPEISVYRQIEPGEKGKVVEVNEEWDYVVLSLDDKLMTEIFGQDRSRDFGPIELMLKRPDGTFVTKVKLTGVKKDKNLGVAGILADWAIAPVHKGDILFY